MSRDPAEGGPAKSWQPPTEDPGNSSSERAQLWRQFAEYSGLAIAMPIATVIGYAAGRWLDSSLGTSFLWLVGLLFGIAAGFVQLVKKALKDSAASERPPR
jgi:F0F1-type ATP synthase assembly protein I